MQMGLEDFEMLTTIVVLYFVSWFILTLCLLNRKSIVGAGAQESRSQPGRTSQVISKYEVIFDKPHGSSSGNPSFSPGETVTGTVTFALSAGNPIRALRLQFIGREKVNWFQEGQYSCKRFLSIMDLAKSTSGDPEKYKFKFKLPDKLPPSYNNKFGNISYWVEPVFGDSILAIIRDFKGAGWEGKQTTSKRNEVLKKYRSTIKINSHFDLSMYPQLSSPISIVRDNSGMFKNENLIEIILALPKQGYIPNEKLNFKAHLINGSEKSITSSTLALIQEVKIAAGPVNRDETKVLFEGSGPTVSIKSCQIWEGNLKIPSRISPISIHCSFISVDYFLRFSVTSSGFMDTVEVKVPIIIGTIPTDKASDVTPNPCNPIRRTASMETVVSQISYCSHGYLDRTSCTEMPPGYAEAVCSSAKLDDNWDALSYSSLPTYENAKANSPE